MMSVDLSVCYADTSARKTRFFARVLWRAARIVVTSAATYGVCAYVIAPRLWRHFEHHPALADAPKTTTTVEDIPGDPLNVGFTGMHAELIRALVAAGWSPADPITLRTSVGIVASVLLRRADLAAPVSSLYVWGRKQDLAFERQVGRSARQRHHIRLWEAPQCGTDGRPLWLGAVTFDTCVGFSHRTGQITHHIGPDIDHERDALLADVKRTGQVLRVYQVTGVGATLQGRNGCGDWYYTDGELSGAVLAVDNVVQPSGPRHLDNPLAVTIKNRVWKWLRVMLPK